LILTCLQLAKLVEIDQFFSLQKRTVLQPCSTNFAILVELCNLLHQFDHFGGANKMVCSVHFILRFVYF